MIWLMEILKIRTTADKVPPFIDNIWGAGLADIQLINKCS